MAPESFVRKTLEAAASSMNAARLVSPARLRDGVAARGQRFHHRLRHGPLVLGPEDRDRAADGGSHHGRGLGEALREPALGASVGCPGTHADHRQRDAHLREPLLGPSGARHRVPSS